jgi:hypothetical protein
MREAVESSSNKVLFQWLVRVVYYESSGACFRERLCARSYDSSVIVHAIVVHFLATGFAHVQHKVEFIANVPPTVDVQVSLSMA